MEISLKEDSFDKLSMILSSTDMYLPWSKSKDEMKELVRTIFTDKEAQVLITFPISRIPMDLVTLDEIAPKVDLPKEEVSQILETLASKALLYSGNTKNGQKGYSLLRRGYGFTQVFFWKGEKNPQAIKVAEIIKRSYGGNLLHAPPQSENAKNAVKGYRYLPINKSVDIVKQSVYPYEMMEDVIAKTKKIALAHCPCRMRFELSEGKSCGHPLEVCMKFDELAEFLIKSGLGREINKAEALDVIRKSDEAGLVHFVENSKDGIKHNCNCCGCACWNVGPIKKRMIPRDMMMATYFIRETDTDRCDACNTCVNICPVEAVQIDGDHSSVDKDWCIGCGVCAPRCPNEAITIVRRTDVGTPPEDFETLHNQIMESGFKQY